MTKRWQHGTVLIIIALSPAAWADIERVYHPYVEQRERELEYSTTVRDLNGDRTWLQRLGAGYSWTDRIFTEAYVISESLTDDEVQVHGYEAELKWQLTEQGEYWADWGLLFEAATSRDISEHEIAAGILWEKAISSHWVGTVNALLEYEYGDDITNEWETALRGQLRYRLGRAFEPAVELYLDDQDKAFGPVILGARKFGAGKNINWELGLLFGLDNRTPDMNLRASIEFEF